MSDKNVSWEDRVVALELEAKQERERRAAVEKTVAEREATIVALKATVAEFKEAADKRRAAEIDGYIGSLKAAVEPNGIEDAKLASVKNLFVAGMDAEAKVLGAALVANAKPPKSGEVLSLSAAKDSEKANTAYLANQLRAAGYTVELSADGTQITKQTPPAHARAGR